MFVTNVIRPEQGVKGAADTAVTGLIPAGSSALAGAAGPPAGAAGSPAGDALEISKLLVEVLQLGHAGRRGGPPGGGGTTPIPRAREATTGARTAPGGPLTSHVIRAAIHVYDNGPQTISQLAAGMGVSQGWASRVVDEMERAGYLERERDPDDRRVVRVRLVPAAVERVEMAYRWRGDSVEEALEGVSPAERAAVTAFLRRFVDAARARG
jgi:DNA-binding MarR family transcriptional regulator